VLDVNQAVRAQGVHAGRTDERAEFDLALGLAYVVIDVDMTRGVNLVGVDPQFGFDVDKHSYLAACYTCNIPNASFSASRFPNAFHA